MRIYSLASGSKGNCTLIATQNINILIDVGLSMKSINEKLMISYGIDLEDIKLILISHSHIDHVSAVKTIYNKYPHIKFYCSEIVYDELNVQFNIKFDIDRFIISSNHTNGSDINITPFELKHDKECQGYMICEKYTSETYVHIADNGKLWDKDIIELLHNKEYYSIESNHDLTLQILDKKRHEGLKRRVLGAYGHTSNVDAMELTFKLIGDNTKSIIYNHLSEECNSPKLASEIHQNLIAIWGKKTEFKNIKIQYAKQNEIVEI